MKQIEASELRVGNLVDYYEENHTFEVLEIHKGGIRVKDNEQETWIEYECFSPIELTEEWLLSLGFKRFCKDFQKDGVIVHTRKIGYVIKKSVPIILSVHQLQNYFYSVTGKELTIKT